MGGLTLQSHVWVGSISMQVGYDGLLGRQNVSKMTPYYAFSGIFLLAKIFLHLPFAYAMSIIVSWQLFGILQENAGTWSKKTCFDS